MKMTRRVFTIAAGAAALLAAQTQKADTFVMIIPDDQRGNFGIGVRSSVNCDWYRVEVFYHKKVESMNTILLLAVESLAPGSGMAAWGETNGNFNIPLDQVQYVQVTFLKVLGQRKIDSNEVEGYATRKEAR